ncbi:hypothetical protein N9Z67_01780 [Rhodopirellula sp.]|nr:hypothetical protein [Rhodopirellula sp.]
MTSKREQSSKVKDMTNDQSPNNANVERTSIQAKWSSEEKARRRRLASNKQLQLRELFFLTAIASQRFKDEGRQTLQLA